MRVDFTVPEQQFDLLKIGQPVAFGRPADDMPFRGTITGIDPKVDPVSRLVSVRAEMTNPRRAREPRPVPPGAGRTAERGRHPRHSANRAGQQPLWRLRLRRAAGQGARGPRTGRRRPHPRRWPRRRPKPACAAVARRLPGLRQGWPPHPGQGRDRRGARGRRRGGDRGTEPAVQRRRRSLSTTPSRPRSIPCPLRPATRPRAAPNEYLRPLHPPARPLHGPRADDPAARIPGHLQSLGAPVSGGRGDGDHHLHGLCGRQRRPHPGIHHRTDRRRRRDDREHRLRHLVRAVPLPAR